MKTLRPVPKPQKPERDPAYLRLVRQLPCCICAAPAPSEAHHCAHGRYAQRKSSDYDAIPLCNKHHRFRTERGETWQTMYGFDTEYIPATRKGVERLIEDQRATIGGRP